MPSPTSQYQFAFNGWVFGGSPTGVQVLAVEGLEDLPSLRTQDDNRGFQDGMFTGQDFLNNRSIVMTLQIMSDSGGTMQEYLNTLKANLLYQTSGTGVLQFMLPDRGLQRVGARVRRRAIKIDPEYTFGKSTATVEFFCPDPRVYDDEEQVSNLNPSGDLGRTYSRVYPLVYATPSGEGSSEVIYNQGNVTVYPVITLTGEMVNPRIVNQTTGAAIDFEYSMAAVDVIVVDTDLRSVTLNGNPARNLLTNSTEWFGFPPGYTTIGIVADTNVSGIATVSYRNGYV